MTTRASTASKKRAGDQQDAGSWYAVQTYYGREETARDKLMHRVEINDFADYIFEAVVPKQTVVKVTDKGEQKTEEETRFGGYLLVRMRMPQMPGFVSVSKVPVDASDNEKNARALTLLRETPGIINFVSFGESRDGIRQPIPLSPIDLEDMLHGADSDDARVNFGFEVGDVVTINDGPFNEFNGTVDAVQLEKGTVRVTVSFFGQDTPVELPFTSVERA